MPGPCFTAAVLAITPVEYFEYVSLEGVITLLNELFPALFVNHVLVFCGFGVYRDKRAQRVTRSAHSRLLLDLMHLSIIQLGFITVTRKLEKHQGTWSQMLFYANISPRALCLVQFKIKINTTYPFEKFNLHLSILVVA